MSPYPTLDKDISGREAGVSVQCISEGPNLHQWVEMDGRGNNDTTNSYTCLLAWKGISIQAIHCVLPEQKDISQPLSQSCT